MNDKFDPNYHKREAEAVNALKNIIPDKLKAEIPISKGMFASLIECPEKNHYLVTANDGAGTKPILAIAMNKFDTIGIDMVAMVANDIATLGNVIDLTLMNYLPCQAKIQKEKITAEIMKGVVAGCELAGAKIGKGETASVDEILGSPKSGYGFDIAGVMTGFIEKNNILQKKVKPGYKIIGFQSSGGHCNGYTGFRLNLLNGDFEERPEIKKLYKGKYSLNDKVPGTNQTIGEALLFPTRIYSKMMRAIGEKFPYIQGVNITGYGLKNFNRVGENLVFHLYDNWLFEPQPIFQLYASETGIPDEKLYESCNMGLGFAIMVAHEDLDKVFEIAKRNGEIARIIGEVESSRFGNSTILHKNQKEIYFYGYQ